MKEKTEFYRVAEYPNKEKGFLIDEEKFGQFSKDIFNYPIFALICGLYLNVVYFFSWRRKAGIISMLVKFFIHYLIIQILLKKVFNLEERK